MARHFEWGRTTKGALPGREPVFKLLTVLIALALGIAVGMYHWERDYTGLEHWYFSSYVRSAVAKWRSFRGNGVGQYQVLDLVDKRRPEQPLATVTDEDAAVRVGKKGNITLRYTDKWINRPHLQAVILTIPVDNGVLHDWLQQNIYGGQDILEVLKWPVEMGGVAAVAAVLVGLFFAIPADRKRAEQRRNGRRVKGSLLLTTAQFNRLFHGDGIGWMNEAELTTWKTTAPMVRIPS